MLKNIYIPRNLLIDIINDYEWIATCRQCNKKDVNMSLCNIVYIYEVIQNNSIGFIRVHDGCLDREALRKNLDFQIGGIGKDFFFGTKEDAIKYVKKLMVIL